MKKIFAVILLFAMLALAGCGQTVPATEPQPENEPIGMPNPWRELTEAESAALCPGALRAPDGAENVQWSVMETAGSAPLVQLSFELDGYTYTAREQATHDKSADISGMNYTWTAQVDMILRNWGDMAGTCYRCIGEGEWADLCAWYDEAAGISYTLSVTAKDLDGFDLQAIAERLTVPQDGDGTLSDEQALTAIRNYCFAANPELAGIVAAGEYPVYWSVEASGEQELVVLFRSYTGALIRYYIDPSSGETYVTEFVPGVSAEEERTGESFNARDCLITVPGTWQTASILVGEDGTASPEYSVRFTDAAILYGHEQDGVFVFDHADPIVRAAETGAGSFLVWAETADGQRYAYRSAESDPAVLEYYETWDEAEFPTAYRGGASLSKCD